MPPEFLILNLELKHAQYSAVLSFFSSCAYFLYVQSLTDMHMHIDKLLQKSSFDMSILMLPAKKQF